MTIAPTLTALNNSDSLAGSANFSDSRFPRADLYGADLRGANLYGADLGGADLRGVRGITEQQVRAVAKVNSDTTFGPLQ
ncbi:pentapeptide repeat-containing protein [Nonomuraea muscovyensis]|uniref:pentapeptide repeat-containing protein n=1 Tax=Nonomuraea muscovyensis TaxID=1124761 RepID=UPI0033F512C1